MPPGAVHRVASNDQPAFAAHERKVEGLRQGLAALDRIEGRHTAGDQSATYVAFVDGAFPIVVAEHWTLGEYGEGEAVYDFNHGGLLRIAPARRPVLPAAVGWLVRADDDALFRARAVRRRNGNDQRQAGRAGRARGARRLASEPRRSRRASPRRALRRNHRGPNRARYACADGAAFARNFDEPVRAPWSVPRTRADRSAARRGRLPLRLRC